MNPNDPASIPNDELPLPPRAGCQFSVARLLLLMLCVAFVLGLVVSKDFSIHAEISLGFYLLLLTTYAILRGPYLFHKIRQLTKIRRQMARRREQLSAELEKTEREK